MAGGMHFGKGQDGVNFLGGREGGSLERHEVKKPSRGGGENHGGFIGSEWGKSREGVQG